MNDSFFRKVAGFLAQSWLLKSGRELWEKNQHNLLLPLSKFQKIHCGVYIILRDYSEGLFPPRFGDRETSYSAEMSYGENLPGMSLDHVVLGHMRKPFFFGRSSQQHLSNFSDVIVNFEKYNIAPPQRILEIGCGSGWMSEFLAITGFDVVGTDINSTCIEVGKKRVSSLKAKEIPCKLDFKVSPMESVIDVVDEKGSFDAVFVYEAMHHAFDWKETLRTAHACLKPGGWLFLFNEPNVIHTFSSYRVARLTKCHEIGFWPGEVKRYLREIKFSNIDYVHARYHFYIRSFSMAAQRMP